MVDANYYTFQRWLAQHWITLSDGRHIFIDPEGDSFRRGFKEPLNTVKGKLGEIFGKDNVADRLKYSSSIREKMQRRGFSSLDQVRDTAGTRIHISNLGQVEETVGKVRSNFKVLEEENYYANPKGFYRSYHLTIEEGGKPVEIQIRTPAQTEFYDKAYPLVYKPKIRLPIGDLAEIKSYAYSYSSYLVGEGAKPKKTALIKRWFA